MPRGRKKLLHAVIAESPVAQGSCGIRLRIPVPREEGETPHERAHRDVSAPDTGAHLRPALNPEASSWPIPTTDYTLSTLGKASSIEEKRGTSL